MPSPWIWAPAGWISTHAADPGVILDPPSVSGGLIVKGTTKNHSGQCDQRGGGDRNI